MALMYIPLDKKLCILSYTVVIVNVIIVLTSVNVASSRKLN